MLEAFDMRGADMWGPLGRALRRIVAVLAVGILMACIGALAAPRPAFAAATICR